MTVSYSLNVSKATFAGFLKLLFRWSGSIYKSMWREALIFCFLFTSLQVIFRHGLTSEEKTTAWSVIQFVNSIGEDVPYSFVLGFYVSFVAGRWMTQFNTVPWPDRLCHAIVAYVHGSDERSRMIRRTLGRYAYLLQILTYQHVSTSVKKRFPGVHHLVEAGLMTPEEMAVYERTSFSYGKWFFPAHWFTALAVRAKKEGRIKDSVMLKALLEEMLSYRTMCAMTIAYDWISVPLAYTQVATITAYFKALTLLLGKQTLDVPSGDGVGFTVDYYFPFVTIYKFLWTVGWLKVAQQILNPYGEDDDDFELNWILDRSVQLVYDIVDRYHLMHPKVKKDAFWDMQEIKLPQTEHSAKYMKNPDLGSAFKLVIDQVKYLPMDELCEKDSDETEYKNESLKRKGASRQNSSFIRRVLNSGFGQSARRKSRKAAASKSWPDQQQGISNPAFSLDDDVCEDSVSKLDSSANMKRSSLKNLVKKISPADRGSCANSKQKNSVKLRQNSYTLDERQSKEALSGATLETCSSKISENETMKWSMKNAGDGTNGDESQDDLEPELVQDVLMPPIPEEGSRANSIASIEYKMAAPKNERTSKKIDGTFEIVKEATEVPQEIRESVQERWKANEGKGYESCCSNVSCEDGSEDSSDENETSVEKLEREDVVVTIEDKIDLKTNSNKS